MARAAGKEAAAAAAAVAPSAAVCFASSAAAAADPAAVISHSAVRAISSSAESGEGEGELIVADDFRRNKGKEL